MPIFHWKILIMIQTQNSFFSCHPFHIIFLVFRSLSCFYHCFTIWIFHTEERSKDNGKYVILKACPAYPLLLTLLHSQKLLYHIISSLFLEFTYDVTISSIFYFRCMYVNTEILLQVDMRPNKQLKMYIVSTGQNQNLPLHICTLSQQ